MASFRPSIPPDSSSGNSMKERQRKRGRGVQSECKRSGELGANRMPAGGGLAARVCTTHYVVNSRPKTYRSTPTLTAAEGVLDLQLLAAQRRLQLVGDLHERGAGAAAATRSRTHAQPWSVPKHNAATLLPFPLPPSRALHFLHPPSFTPPRTSVPVPLLPTLPALPALPALTSSQPPHLQRL